MTIDRWDPPAEPAVAVLGADDGDLEAAVRSAGATVTDREGCDLVIAVGPAVLASALGSPVLPVGVDPVGLDRSGAPAAIKAVLREGAPVQSQPVLSVTTDGESVSGVFDVTLTAATPGRIVEVSVHRDRDQLERVRADGLVVATPIGSWGYAHAAGGPRLEPDTASLAVVPIAAFSLASHRRVVSIEQPLSIRVERDEEPVALYVDGAAVTELEEDESISVSVTKSLAVLEP